MYDASKYGSAPEFKYIADESRKAALVTLRAAIAPLLDNNILTHFTDHSVFHSDSLVNLISKLIEPIQTGDNRLNDQELTILYAACYLHDIGMHNELAGDTQVIQNAIEYFKYSQKWDELQPQTQIDLIRKYHHHVSAEMIGRSVQTEIPMVGIQLTDLYDPGRIAAICEAHCEVFVSARYIALTKEGPGIRMQLLAGLLRVADILDETRPRAERAKARILNLSLESKIHWWRHDYTEDVTIEPSRRVITLWFDFPPDRVDEYNRIIPQLQKPWIEVELSNQSSVFGGYGLNWTLLSRVGAKEYGSAETMPDDVLAAMIRQLHRRQLSQAEDQRMAVIVSYKEAQSLISRRLDELNNKKETMSPVDYIHAVSQVVNEMWDFGAKRSAWFRLHSVYNEHKSELSSKERVTLGMKLAEMMMLDETANMAAQVLSDLTPIVETIDDHDLIYSYWKLRAQCYYDNCFDETPDTIAMAIKYAPDEEACELLSAWLAEWHLLQTDLLTAAATAQEESRTE